jgi:hypothetical protein
MMPVGTFTKSGLFAAGGASAFTLDIDTTKAGSASDTFILATTNAGSDAYTIDWGDGSDTVVTGTASPSHTYTTGGLYTVTIDGYVDQIYFFNGGDKLKVLSINFLSGMGASMLNSFYGCSNLLYVTGELSSGLSNMERSFAASGLLEWTLDIPEGVTSCSLAWQSCNLTSFISILPSSLLNCYAAWHNCNLTSWSNDLPANINNLAIAWEGNNLTTWTKPLPSGCTNYSRSWRFNALDQTSVDFILTNIESHGTTNGTLDINGGTNATPSAAGQTATDALRARGWTVTLNGY